MFGEKLIIDSVVFDEQNNTIEVVKRQQSNRMFASNPPRPVPDFVWKEVYGVVDGKITIVKRQEGKHIPASMNSEQIVFE